MSEESGGGNDGGIRIDGKYITLGIFLAGQLGVAVWWAGVKSAQIETLQRDVQTLTSHMDKKLDRMEEKIDQLKR